jgi:L-fuculose-phosphate aldolase
MKKQFKHPADIIVEYMNRIYTHGMTTTSGGNLSIIDSDGNMWISPGSIDKVTLRREDIVCVKKDGNICGCHKPSCEYPFHLAVYKLRPDVKAVLHAHPPALVSFSIAAKTPELATMPLFKEICGSVGFAIYDIPGSSELGDKVAAEFAKGHNTILLENHGTCCAAESMEEAFKRFETLDFAARTISNAIALGKPAKLAPAKLDKYFENRNTGFTTLKKHVVSSAEQDARRQLEAFTKRAYEQFLFTSTSGTFAVRVDDDSFLVTPACLDRANATAADFVLVKKNAIEEGKTPDRFTWFFKEIFEKRPDISAISMSSPPYIMGYAVANAPFDPRVIPESYLQLREMPTFPFGAQYTKTKQVLNTISQRNPVVMFNNDCMITIGNNILQTFDRMEVAEYSAKATIAAQAFGGMTPINEKQVADLVKAFNLIP